MCYGGEYSYKLAQSFKWINEEDLKRLEDSGIKSEHYFYPKNKVPIVLKEGKDYRVIESRFDLIAPYFVAANPDLDLAGLIKLKNSSKKDERGRPVSYPTWNARSETIHEKVSFAAAWNSHKRAVIPITSFYERPNERDTPPEFKNKEFQLFLKDPAWLGVLWDKIEVKGESLYSFAIVTRDSDGHKIQKEIHHIRMPTLLTVSEAAEWLDPSVGADRAFDLVDPYPEELIRIAEKIREPKKPNAT